MKLTILAAQLAGWGWPLSGEQQQQFEQYRTLLLAWNERMNLTAVAEPAAIERRHFLDSLSCVQVTGSLDGRSLVDAGAGAGFPGLPLKILFPGMQLTLVESVAKKGQFLAAAVAELGLTGVTILTERVETVGRQPAHREQYDWAVARAVAEMRVLVEYLLPLCRLGGRMLAMKGGAAPEETAAAATAIERLGGGAPRLVPVRLPDPPAEFTLVVVPKERPTPTAYPRRPGLPAKRPL